MADNFKLQDARRLLMNVVERLNEVQPNVLSSSATQSETRPYHYRPYAIERRSPTVRRISQSLNRPDPSQRIFCSGGASSSRSAVAVATSVSEPAGPSHRYQAEGESRPSPYAERSSLFRRLAWSGSRGKQPCRRGKKLSVWKHDFVCLAYKRQNWVPEVTEMIQLKNCGLGLQTIRFTEHGSAIIFHQELMEAYCQLKEGGGYELLRRREGNSKELSLIPSPPGGVHSVLPEKSRITCENLCVPPSERPSIRTNNN